MGYEIRFVKSGLIFGSAFTLAMAAAQPAKALVDVWNEDGVTYRVEVIEKSGQISRQIPAGEFWKGVCNNCIVKVSPISGETWVDQIEASGQDVVTIEHGSLRIGEGSRN